MLPTAKNTEKEAVPAISCGMFAYRLTRKMQTMENRNCSSAAVHIIRKDKAVSPVLSFHLICHIIFGSFKSLTLDLPNAFERARSNSAMETMSAEANGQTTVRIVSVKAVPS